MPVRQLIAGRLPATLKLLALAFVVAWSVSLGLALLIAGEPNARRLGSATAATGFAALASLPTAALALGGLLLVPAGWLRPFSAAAAALPAVPALVLAASIAPGIYFQVLNAINGAWQKPFMTAAAARGNGCSRLLLRHALPNALDILIPLAALTVTQLLVEAVIVENVLAWPGIGQLSLTAAAQRDLPLVCALVLTATVVVVGTNFLSDALQICADPRLRQS